MAVKASKTKTEGRGGHTGPTGPGPGRRNEMDWPEFSDKAV